MQNIYPPIFTNHMTNFHSATHLPALNHLGGNEFITLLKSQANEDTKTVVFIENKLSVEDFSQCRLKTKTCFENLQRIEDKTFLNSVEDPVESLIASYKKKKTISVSNEDDLKDIDAQDEKILLVYLDNVENPEDFDKHGELSGRSDLHYFKFNFHPKTQMN